MQYFMVHNGVNGIPCKVMHTEIDTAKAEAKRLAELNVGTDYYVLQSVYVYSVTKPQATGKAIK